MPNSGMVVAFVWHLFCFHNRPTTLPNAIPHIYKLSGMFGIGFEYSLAVSWRPLGGPKASNASSDRAKHATFKEHVLDIVKNREAQPTHDP